MVAVAQKDPSPRRDAPAAAGGKPRLRCIVVEAAQVLQRRSVAQLVLVLRGGTERGVKRGAGRVQGGGLSVGTEVPPAAQGRSSPHPQLCDLLLQQRDGWRRLRRGRMAWWLERRWESWAQRPRPRSCAPNHGEAALPRGAEPSQTGGTDELSGRCWLETRGERGGLSHVRYRGHGWGGGLPWGAAAAGPRAWDIPLSAPWRAAAFAGSSRSGTCPPRPRSASAPARCSA